MITKTTKLFLILFVFALGISGAIGRTFASTDNCKDYDICPPEVKKVQFSLQKLVRKEGQVGYVREVTVNPGDRVEFVIRADNNGQLATDEMQIIDYLPVEFSLLNGETNFNFDNFKVGETKEIKLTVLVTDEIERDTCLTNQAELSYQKIAVSSASASVCIVKEETDDDGDVLSAATDLPKTASVSYLLIIPFAAVVIGFVINRKVKI